jgi:hypothetical protein
MEKFNLTCIQTGEIVKTIVAINLIEAKKYFESIGKDTDTDYFVESAYERAINDRLQKNTIYNLYQ